MAIRDNGGHAFPTTDGQWEGMTLRDYFATIVDKDEYGDLVARNLTRESAETLAGPYPAEPGRSPSPQERIDFRLACLSWEFRVRSALRYMMADAMLAERAK